MGLGLNTYIQYMYKSIGIIIPIEDSEYEELKDTEDVQNKEIQSEG